MIVVMIGVVVVIIAAIALPVFVYPITAANERNAAASLKSLSSAQADFRANDRDANGDLDFYVRDVHGLYARCPDGTEPIEANMIKL